MVNAFGGKAVNAKPPEKGSFPLDREGTYNTVSIEKCKRFIYKERLSYNENIRKLQTFT